MKKPNLSQSLLKDYQEYWNHKTLSCGYYIFKRHFQRLPVEQSYVQRLGDYFEYLCTGYTRPDSQPPQPEYVFKGTPREKMAADYERATQSAEAFKNMIKKYGIEILKTGEHLRHESDFGTLSGILDIRAIWEGKEVIIDLKYSGLIDDKFSPYGWAIESLVDRPSLTIQALHYKYMIRQIEAKENIDFYYFVFSTKDSQKSKIIRINAEESALYRHELDVKKIARFVEHHYENADKYASDIEIDYSSNVTELVARPSLSKCLDCPYFATCDKRAEVPIIEEIQLF